MTNEERATRDLVIWINRRKFGWGPTEIARRNGLSKTRVEQLIARGDMRAMKTLREFRRDHPELHGPAGDVEALRTVSTVLGISPETLEAIVVGAPLPRGIAESPTSG